MNTDNDIIGSVDPNANAWTHRGHGVLEAIDGSQGVYNGHVHYLFNWSQGYRVLSGNVNLH